MRITFVGHASILIETKGVRILSDPWWGHPCFGAQWWTYPLPIADQLDLSDIDFIYISHGHHDHFHPGTLKKFKRNCKVLVSKDINLDSEIGRLGFDVISVAQDEVVQLSDEVKCVIWPTYGDDTLMVIDDGDEVCVNANDAIHAAPVEVQDFFIKKIRQKYLQIDYLFCGFGVASHFPNCYKVPGKDDFETAFKRQKHFNLIWARVAANMEPVYAFPFAADVALLEHDLYFVNEPTQKAQLELIEDFRQYYPLCKTQSELIAPGFIIEDKSIIANIRRSEVNMDRFKVAMAAQIDLANRYGDVSDEYFDSIVDLLKKNIEACYAYLCEYDKDYVFGIDIRKTEKRIIINKSDDKFNVTVSDNKFPVDLLLITRAPYLKQSLGRSFGDEILFVGSGCIFEYFDRALMESNLHSELKVIVTYHKVPPKSRFGKDSKLIFTLKNLIKKCIKRKGSDLYDLNKWLVFIGS